MRLTTLLSVAGLLALAGCVGGLGSAPVIGPTNTWRYLPTSNSAFLGNGQLVLIGQATTPEMRQQLAQVAATGIADGAFGGKFLLVPRDEAEIPSRNRVVVVVGGANSWTLCTDPPDRGGNFSGLGLRVSAAACQGTTRLSSTSGTVGRLDGPDDPNLAYFFKQIGAALFPGRNIDYLPQDRGRRRR